MKKIKGPAIFLAQFIGDKEPFNSLPSICKWVSDLGYKGIQLPAENLAVFDLDRAASSKDYCDEIKGIAKNFNLEITDIASHLTGQLVAVHPAYDTLFDGFAADEVKGNPKARQEWAVKRMMNVAQASKNLNLKTAATFSGALCWPFLYPFPQRPKGLEDEAFGELAKRWHPILDKFDECGVDLCYEIHPSEDLHDGSTFEMFLDRPNQIMFSTKVCGETTGYSHTPNIIVFRHQTLLLLETITLLLGESCSVVSTLASKCGY